MQRSSTHTQIDSDHETTRKMMLRCTPKRVMRGKLIALGAVFIWSFVAPACGGNEPYSSDKPDPKTESGGTSPRGPCPSPLPAEQCRYRWECRSGASWAMKNPFGENCYCRMELVEECTFGCNEETGRCLAGGAGGEAGSTGVDEGPGGEGGAPVGS
jgi:hypothetical protein